MNSQVLVQIPGLTRLDQLQLQKHLKTPELEIKADKPHDGESHGELATATAVVIVSLAALKVLAIWLAKTRTSVTGTTIKRTFDPTGQCRETVTKFEIHTNGSEAEVLKALGEATSVDVTSLVRT